MIVSRSSRFKRSFKKLPSEIQKDFEKNIHAFIENPFDTSLKTHKLHGNLASYYAFDLRDGYRILFDLIDSNTALLVNIGSHDDYKKWSR